MALGVALKPPGYFADRALYRALLCNQNSWWERFYKPTEWYQIRGEEPGGALTDFFESTFFIFRDALSDELCRQDELRRLGVEG